MNFNVFFANLCHYVIKQYTVHVHSMLASFCHRNKLSGLLIQQSKLNTSAANECALKASSLRYCRSLTVYKLKRCGSLNFLT